MWLSSSLAGYSIIIESLLTSSNDNFGIKLVTLHEFVELMDTNQKTDKCDEGKDAAKKDKVEPGIEFLKTAPVTSTVPSFSTSTHLNLLPSIHNPITTPFFNTYRNVLQGWKNSVPKLYKYSPSDIEVVVYRKNGQVDTLKAAGSGKCVDASRQATMGQTSSVIPVEKNDAVSCNNVAEIVPLEGLCPAADSKSTNNKTVDLLVSDEIRDLPNEINQDVVREIASEAVAGTLQQALIVTGLDATNSDEQNTVPIVPINGDTNNISAKDVTSVETCENGNAPSEYLGFSNCCHAKFNNKDSIRFDQIPGIIDVGVSKALLDVATQATAQIVKVVETSIQNVPHTRDAGSQWENIMYEMNDAEMQTTSAALAEKFTETDPSPVRHEIGCQTVSSTTSAAFTQTNDPKMKASSCQSFFVQISEQTQTERNNAALMDSYTQTFMPHYSISSQTDPDILRHRAISMGCQSTPEVSSVECQITEHIDRQGASVQCTPDQDSKAVQLSGLCCRMVEKRIRIKYEAKLRKLLTSIEESGIKKAYETTTNGAAEKAVAQQVAATESESTEEEYTPEMIQQMIATFKQRQKENDELQDELKRAVEQLTEQVSISKSLDSHEYFEDDWIENTPTPSA